MRMCYVPHLVTAGNRMQNHTSALDTVNTIACLDLSMPMRGCAAMLHVAFLLSAVAFAAVWFSWRLLQRA